MKWLFLKQTYIYELLLLSVSSFIALNSSSCSLKIDLLISFQKLSQIQRVHVRAYAASSRNFFYFISHFRCVESCLTSRAKKICECFSLLFIYQTSENYLKLVSDRCYLFPVCNFANALVTENIYWAACAAQS